MRVGFAVKVLGDGGLRSHDTRRWQSGPHLRTSLGYLAEILSYLDAHGIRMYRMATALAPYASHPGLPQFHRQVEECAEELAAVGSCSTITATIPTASRIARRSRLAIPTWPAGGQRARTWRYCACANSSCGGHRVSRQGGRVTGARGHGPRSSAPARRRPKREPR